MEKKEGREEVREERKGEDQDNSIRGSKCTMFHFLLNQVLLNTKSL